ncbi:hypothetical protein V7056_10695 [Bacillus sp. JJ664]
MKIKRIVDLKNLKEDLHGNSLESSEVSVTSSVEAIYQVNTATYPSICTSIREIIDNSLAAIKSTSVKVKKIYIEVHELEDGVLIGIHDTAGGVKDIGKLVRFGYDKPSMKKNRPTVYNEHSIGGNTSLASLDGTNNGFFIATWHPGTKKDGVQYFDYIDKFEDNTVVYKVPFKKLDYYFSNDKEVEGGTITKITMEKHKFYGIEDDFNITDKSINIEMCFSYLKEMVRAYYGKNIQRKEVSIYMEFFKLNEMDLSDDASNKMVPLESLYPSYKEVLYFKQGYIKNIINVKRHNEIVKKLSRRYPKADFNELFNSEEIEITINKGILDKESSGTNKYFYKVNSYSDLAILYVNGRIIQDVYRMIYNRVRHPSKNNEFLEVAVDISNHKFYFNTKADKTQVHFGDYKFRYIIEVIKKYIKETEKNNKDTHKEKLNKIQDSIKNDGYKELKVELPLIKTDFIYEKLINGEINLLEFKNCNFKIEHVHQALGYVTHLLHEGQTIDYCILLVKEFNEGYKISELENYIIYISGLLNVQFYVVTEKKYVQDFNAQNFKDRIIY